jgi:hypothetical protein
MVVLIDPPAWPAHGRLWSHLVSDSSLAQLHAFARGLAVPARGFDGDHYDVPEGRYASIVAAGAQPVSGRELLRRLQASGLRRSKRRGERVLASMPHGPSGHRLDVLSSGLQPSGAVVAVTLVVQRRVGRSVDLLVVPNGHALRLPRTAVPAGRAFQGVAEDLIGDLLGPPAGRRPEPTQLGFLRYVPQPAGAACGFDVVLGWRSTAGPAGEGHDPMLPARWLPAGRVARELEPILAALLPHDRVGEGAQSLP